MGFIGSIRNLGGARVSPDIERGENASTKKTHGSGMKQFRSQLKDGMRNLAKCFNRKDLSAKVHPYNAATVQEAKTFATGEIKKTEDQLQKKLNSLGSPNSSRKPEPSANQSYHGNTTHNKMPMQEQRERPYKRGDVPQGVQFNPPQQRKTSDSSFSRMHQAQHTRNTAPAMARPQHEALSTDIIPSWDSHTRARAQAYERKINEIDAQLHPNLRTREENSLLREQRAARDDLQDLLRGVKERGQASEARRNNNLSGMGKQSDVDLKSEIKGLTSELSRHLGALNKARERYAASGYEDKDYENAMDSAQEKVSAVEEKLARKKSELRALTKAEESGKPASREWNIRNIPNIADREEARELERIASSPYDSYDDDGYAQQSDAEKRLKEIAAKYGMKFRA